MIVNLPRRVQTKRAVVALLFLTLMVPLLCRGWGGDGHVCVNNVAAQKIPDSMPAFLKAATATLAYLGPEPDRWRDSSESTLKEAQEPDHFIDLERIAWLDVSTLGVAQAARRECRPLGRSRHARHRVA